MYLSIPQILICLDTRFRAVIFLLINASNFIALQVVQSLKYIHFFRMGLEKKSQSINALHISDDFMLACTQECLLIFLKFVQI